MTVLNVVQAVNHALREEMARNDKVIILGEDVGVNGGVFRATEGLYQEFGPNRVIDTPLAESGIIGVSIGMALYGLRPVPEIQFMDFIYPGFDQIQSELAKFRYRSGGQFTTPVVIRTPYGGGIRGSHYHSQSTEAFFAHTPGLKVVIPATPYDAKGLLIASIRDGNIVVFFEHKALYAYKGGIVPEEQYEIPLGKADVKKEGKDLTIVALGRMTHLSLEAATQLKKEGINAEVIDPRTIVPLDKDTILHSVKKTSRLIIVDEDYLNCGFASEVAAIVSDEAFGFIDAPIKRIANPNIPIPYAKHLEETVLPSVDKIVATSKELVKF